MRLKQKLTLYTLAGSIFFTAFSFFLSAPTVSAAFHNKESDCTNASGVWYQGKCWFDKSVGKPKCNSVNGNWHEILLELAPQPIPVLLSEPKVGYCGVEERPDDPPDTDECFGNINAVTGECVEYRECQRYSNRSERRACVQGYRTGQSACEDLSGSKKEACMHGARNGDNPPVAPTDQCIETNVIEVGCSSGSNNPIWNILLLIINILATGVGLVAVGGVVYGGILYATAQNNSSQITKAKTTIANTIFGLAAFALMYSFLQYLIPGGFINNLTNPPAIPPPSVSNTPSGDNGNNNDNGNQNNNDDLPNPSGNINAINSVHNMRDASASNNVLKPKLLYRSPELAGINSQDKRTLQGVLRGGVIIDMRLNGGRNDDPDPRLKNVDNKHVPADLQNMDYRSFVNNSGNRRAFGEVFRIVANTDRPVLIHCTHGKDRTGWAVAMIMHALGGTKEQIMKEYLKSNASGEHVEKAWLNAGLEEARQDYGSITKYIKEGLGVSDATLNKLKQKMKA